MRRVRGWAGFTLIELIVVISLMGMLTSMGLVMFSVVTDRWRQATVRTDLDAAANAVFDEMRQDFSEVVSAKLTGAVVRGTARTAEDRRFYKVPLEDDQIVIPVETVAGADGRKQRMNVRYVIDRKEAPPALVRMMTVPGSGGAAVTQVKVASGVLAMRIEYLDKDPDSAWQPDWTQSTAPDAVRVSIMLMDADTPFEQISRKAVFPIEVD